IPSPRGGEGFMSARGLPSVGPALAGLCTIATALVLWEVADSAGWFNKLIAPAPSAIAGSLSGLFADEELIPRFFQTFGEALAAALCAVLVGVPIGWWLHHKSWAGRAYETWIASLASAPIVLLYPLYLVIFGRNAATIIAMSFCTGLPSIVLKTKE